MAKMYVLPVAMIGGNIGWDLSEFFLNLAYVTAGNIVVGSFFVAGAYWIVLFATQPENGTVWKRTWEIIANRQNKPAPIWQSAGWFQH